MSEPAATVQVTEAYQIAVHEDDANVFLEGEKPVKVRTVGGEEVAIPTTTFRREQTILKAIGELIHSVTQGEAFQQGIAKADMAAVVLNLVFTDAPERLARIAAAICGKEEEWAQDNLDTETILELLVPFLKYKQTRIVAVVARMTGNLQTAVAAVKQFVPTGQE